MRLIHTSDWHIGKYLNDFSLLEDQRFYLNKLKELAVSVKADAMIVAGDIYDRSVPPAEAVEVLNDFLSEITLNHHIPVFMISGNHDGYRRLAFGNDFFKEQNLYINSNENGVTSKITLHDEYGAVNFYLIPYVEPAGVRERLCDQSIKTYNDAFETVLLQMMECVDLSQRNIAVAHGFFSVVSEEKQKKEEIYSQAEITVGGTDLINAKVLLPFDYVALGHLHQPHEVGEKHLRYAGSMLKYSIAEALQKKAVYIVDVLEKGNVCIQEEEIKPLRDLKIIAGRFDELMDKHGETVQYAGDYVFTEIIDEGDILDAANKLRTVYPYLLGLRFISKAQAAENSAFLAETANHKSIDVLFSDFFESVTGEELSEQRKSIMKDIIEGLQKEAQ